MQFGNWREGSQEIAALKAENERLRADNERLRAEVNRLEHYPLADDEKQAENERLRAALDSGRLRDIIGSRWMSSPSERDELEQTVKEIRSLAFPLCLRLKD